MIIIRSYFMLILSSITLVVIIMFSTEIEGGDTPTPTPPPEIFEFPVAPPSEETLPIVNDLLAVDKDCLLPCFWRFHLGESLTKETTDFVIRSFQQTPSVSYAIERREVFAESELSSNRGIDFYETLLPLSDGQLQVIFGSTDDVLLRVHVRLYMPVNWLEENPFILSEVLDTYGEPTDVYMRYSGAPIIGYVLAVVYEDQGFIVEYRFGNDLSSNQRLMNERITKEGRLLICDEDATYDSIDLTLQIDGNPTSLIDVLQPSLDDPSVFRPFWNIEDMTGLNIEEFTEAFAGNPAACVEAFSLSELREQGYE